MTFILIHALLKEQMQIKFKKRHQDDLAVPGFKVNIPRHIGGKDSVFFDLRFAIYVLCQG